MLSNDPYIRRVRVERVIDGDTLDVIIDLGFGIYKKNRIRLLNVNTPELKSDDVKEKAAAVRAKQFTEDWIAARSQGEWPFLIKSEKVDAFGRYLTILYKEGETSLNDLLLETGNAIIYARNPI